MYDPNSGDCLQHPFLEILEGWPIMKVLESGAGHGIPPEDFNGRLYFYLDNILAFCTRMATSRMSIDLTCASPNRLPSPT